MRPRGHIRSRKLFHRKVAGQPFGIYSWSRTARGGVVVRIGPLGHVQLSHYRGQLVGAHAAGRRGKHGVALSVWGVRGRRRKVTLEIAVHL